MSDPILQRIFEKIPQADLARELGRTRQAVSGWKRVPSDHLPRVSRLTGIPPEEIRPDLYQESAA